MGLFDSPDPKNPVTYKIITSPITISTTTLHSKRSTRAQRWSPSGFRSRVHPTGSAPAVSIRQRVPIRRASPALTASFDLAKAAARLAIPAPLAARADYRGVELSERLVRRDFSCAMTPPTVALSGNVTIGANLSGHNAELGRAKIRRGRLELDRALFARLRLRGVTGHSRPGRELYALSQ